MPLSTIVHCYQAEVDDLNESNGSDASKRDLDLGIDEEGSEEDGVPMEHLITCIKGVQVGKVFVKDYQYM